jgi:hypothetical protein
LTREQNEKIKKDKVDDDDVNIFLFKDGKYKKVGAAHDFKRFPMAAFIEYENRTRKDPGINILQLEEEQIRTIAQKLEEKIDKKLENYQSPELQPKYTKRIREVNYKGREYKLMEKFGLHPENISSLIYAYNETTSALKERYEYRIYFKSGFTYRDDSFLRFINFVQNGKSKMNEIAVKYEAILSEPEVQSTINKLIDLGCLKSDGTNISITQLGKNIL